MAHHVIDGGEYMNVYPFSPNLVTIRALDNWQDPNYSQSQHSQPASLTENSQEAERLREPQEQAATENEDTFGLEFAAVQWLNLVTNAEELFNKLLNSIVLTNEEKEQIQRWLCLKQECEECVASDEATSIGEKNRHSLDRIEELTERTGNSTNSLEKSSDSQYESETESDFDCQHPDFEDKLFGYMERFKDKTDTLIRRKLEIEETVGEATDRAPYGSANNPVYQQGRRMSLHPGSIHLPPSLTDFLPDKSQDTNESFQSENSNPKTDEPSKNSTSDADNSMPLEPYKELKLLSSGNDAKKTQIKQVLVDLEGAHKRIDELQHTIQIKEQFIKEMVRNSETRNNAKMKFQRKWSRLEEEYYKTRTQLAQAENALHETKHQGSHNTVAVQKTEVEKYKNLARHYEKRLKDIDMIKQIAGDSAKKVLELEDSLQYSKKQMEKLKKKLRKEESYKHKLEQELQEDQQKMKELEEKYNLQMSTLLEKEKKRDGKKDGGRMKWIAEETERLNVMRESSQKLHEQLVQQQGMLDKREAMLKEKVTLEKQRTKNIAEVSARISHLESMLKEKGSNFDKSEEKDKKEQFRQEIHNLRRTRDHLLEQKCDLDEKYHKDRRLSSTEERKYLECGEAIEAIDAAIEYKNELICGRKGMETEADVEREQGEQLLMARLFKLSTDELRTLLYKYFQKVIDLRESGRRMEEQLDEVEKQTDVQSWKLQELNNALQAVRLEGERRLVALQRDHQEKVHLMLRHFAEESGSSGTEASRHLVVSRDTEASKLKRENKALRRRIQEMEALMQAAAATRGVMRLRSRSASPDPRPLKSLTAPPSTTKVTREKNKVIIITSKSKSTKQDVLLFQNHK